VERPVSRQEAKKKQTGTGITTALEPLSSATVEDCKLRLASGGEVLPLWPHPKGYEARQDGPNDFVFKPDLGQEFHFLAQRQGQELADLYLKTAWACWEAGFN
jgi:hypothetical protein